MEDFNGVIDSFRRWGYLQADLDPLGYLKPVSLPELEMEDEASKLGRRWYCGTVGVEFMHIADPIRRAWIQQRVEQDEPEVDKSQILGRLISAETFEQVLQSRYPGTKRFSLEGLASLIPLLDEILNTAARHGATEAVIGMSHRGRLNVMVHIIGTPAVNIFAEFEDVDPRSVLGGGDVKPGFPCVQPGSASAGRRNPGV